MKKSVVMFFGSVFVVLFCLGSLLLFGLNTYQNSKSDELRYEIESHGVNIIIFDRQTGDYWIKYLALDEGPSDWQKELLPTE